MHLSINMLLSKKVGYGKKKDYQQAVKIRHHLNHFAIRAKLLIRANQVAFGELQRLKGA